ncbi:MAG: sigma-54 dependent transcriptional regulator [Acidobacteria bacterium]|nr:sigma-54 dependent transcriptional regulator [Acidobacteriota bacterium]
MSVLPSLLVVGEHRDFSEIEGVCRATPVADFGSVPAYLMQGGVDALLAAGLPDIEEAEEFLRQTRETGCRVPVLIHLPGGRPFDSIHLTRLGATQVFLGELDPAAVAGAVGSLVSRQQKQDKVVPIRESWTRLLVGESHAMQQVSEVIRLVGHRRSTVLITGETGTGKEVVARAIHMASDRSQLPMVAVNCSAIPEHLLEAELFGHTKGAVTGAIAQRVGRFEQAQRSTIFLDEIAAMPLGLQAKLLRVLQEREIYRLGSSEPVTLDCRVIAATNSDLKDAVDRGTFRRDLYYRLNVVPMRIPALRERMSDIPLLVNHFAEKICRLEDLPIKHIAAEAMDKFQSYSWPGNVRELEHSVERAIALSGERRVLYAADFQLGPDTEGMGAGYPALIEVPADGMDFEETINRIELAILDQALRRCRGNKARAADLLRMKRTTLVSKVKALGYCAS